MTKNFLFFIPFHNPWKWHTDYANQTATILSRNHIVICFLWGDAVSVWEILRRHKPYRPLTRQKTLWKIQPLYLFPGKRFFTIQLINIFMNILFAHILCSYIAFQHKSAKLFWFFGYYDPVFLLLPPFFRHWKTIYDCVDIATHPNTKLAHRILKSETHLLDYAWIVVTNSQTLHGRIRTKRPDVYMVPLGFRINMFHRPSRYVPAYSGSQPVIGYIGSIDYRLDFSVLFHLVTRHPSWHFTLTGPVFYDHLSAQKKETMEKIFAMPNVTHDMVRPTVIPHVLSRISVAIIPYDMRVALSKYAYPMKIMEYFYAQKPVVSSPIDELLRFTPLIRLARTNKEWDKAIFAALTHPMTRTQKNTAKTIAKANSWEQKIAAIMKFISVAAVREKLHDI